MQIARTSSGWALRLNESVDMYELVSPDHEVVLSVEYTDLLDIGTLFRENVQTATDGV